MSTTWGNSECTLFDFKVAFELTYVWNQLPDLFEPSSEVFITGQAILGGAEPSMGERVAIFSCRIFIYLGSMCRILFCNLPEHQTSGEMHEEETVTLAQHTHWISCSYCCAYMIRGHAWFSCSRPGV